MSSTAHSPTAPRSKSPKKGLSSAAGEDPGGPLLLREVAGFPAAELINGKRFPVSFSEVH